MVEIGLCDQTFELILQRQLRPARIAFAQLMSAAILDLMPLLLSVAVRPHATTHCAGEQFSHSGRRKR
jgi:hypothetical protein